MAWIKSDQALRQHPKVADLMASMNWSMDTTLAKLHRFWWWCVDYAEDGDLRKHNENRIAASIGLQPGEPAKRFVAAMIAAKWIDQEPYLRVHDWWEHVGPWLQSKYRRSPEKWQGVRDAYHPENDKIGKITNLEQLRRLVLSRDGQKCVLCEKSSNLHLHHIKRVVDRIDLCYDPKNAVTLCAEDHYKVTGNEQKFEDELTKYVQRTYININQIRSIKSDLDNQINPDDAFDRFWAAYPRKVGKGAAEKAWSKIQGVSSLLTRMLEAIEQAKRTPQWTKDAGQFIPHPATWLNQKRWEDEPEAPHGRVASHPRPDRAATLDGLTESVDV